MDIESAVEELYGLSASEFTGRRDEIAAQAKADKHAGLAREVRALRKPTAAAALVNRLAREASDVLAEYLDLGERLRAAQSRLAGDQLRTLGQQRQRAGDALVNRAKALGGGKVSVSVLQEVDATLRAAVADPAAAQAVASGRITRALSYAGFGEVDISAATATPLAPHAVREPGAEPEQEAEPSPGPAQKAPRPAGVTILAERQASADRDVAVAEADVRQTREAAERAASAAQTAATAQRDAEQEVDDLRERLAQARFAVRAAQQEVATAQGSRAAAERAVTAAEKVLTKARSRRAALGDDGER